MKLLKILTESIDVLNPPSVKPNAQVFTGADIAQRAGELGMNVKTVIPSDFAELEYLAVYLTRYKTAFFLMDNETFGYTYSFTYDAVTDKTTMQKPRGF
jgi:hypothetical protein